MLLYIITIISWCHMLLHVCCRFRHSMQFSLVLNFSFWWCLVDTHLNYIRSLHVILKFLDRWLNIWSCACFMLLRCPGSNVCMIWLFYRFFRKVKIMVMVIILMKFFHAVVILLLIKTHFFLFSQRCVPSFCYTYLLLL